MVEDRRFNECKWAFVAVKKYCCLQRQMECSLRRLQAHFYYMASIGNNTRYWDLTLQEKMNLNVFCHYNKMMYEMIDSFTGCRPMFCSSHVHNFMALDDHVFEVHFMQLKQNKTILFNSSNFISSK